MICNQSTCNLIVYVSLLLITCSGSETLCLHIQRRVIYERVWMGGLVFIFIKNLAHSSSH